MLPTPPVDSIIINKGNTVATNPVVSVEIKGLISEYRQIAFSNRADFQGAKIVDLPELRSWNLCADENGNATDCAAGEKKMYIKMYDRCFDPSPHFTRTILYQPKAATDLPITSAKKEVFKRLLKVGSRGDDVKLLQQFLNQHGFPVTKKGPGSPGNETTYFGSLTREALTHFQKSNAKKIISGAKWKDTLGTLGNQTRAFVNGMVNLPVKKPVVTPTKQKFTFNRNLELRNQGSDVRELQKLLNSQGFVLAQDGPGSPGNETDMFGALTWKALVKFQNANAQKILRGAEWKDPVGTFGTQTRGFVKTLTK